MLFSSAVTILGYQNSLFFYIDRISIAIYYYYYNYYSYCYYNQVNFLFLFCYILPNSMVNWFSWIKSLNNVHIQSILFNMRKTFFLCIDDSFRSNQSTYSNITMYFLIQIGYETIDFNLFCTYWRCGILDQKFFGFCR